MQRALWNRNALRTVSLLRNFPCITQYHISRRYLAWLTENSEYLASLLAKSGLRKFSTPLEGFSKVEPLEDSCKNDLQSSSIHGGRNYIYARFTIDSNEPCIKGSISLSKEHNKSHPIVKFEAQYPPYDSNKSAPVLSNLDMLDPAKTIRVKELAQIMWRTFCMNGFLFLNIEGTMYENGSIEFSRCSAQVDESAIDRQTEIFQHVSRTKHPDELQAEKSLLVYRRYSSSNVKG